MISRFLSRLKIAATSDKEIRHVLYSTVWVVSIRVVSLLLSFVQSIVVARVLGIEEYGAYAFAYSLATMAALVAVLGFDRVCIRETVIAEKNQDWPSMKGIRLLAERNTFLVGTLVGGGLSLYYGFFGENQVTSAQSACVAIVLLAPWVALLKLEPALLRAYGKIRLSQLPDNIVRPLLLLLFLLASSAMGNQVSGSHAISLHALAAFLVVVWCFWQVNRAAPAILAETTAHIRYAEMYRTSFAVGMVTVLGAFKGQLVLLMMGGMLPAAEIGAFSAAFRLSSLISFTLVASNIALGPTMTRMYKEGSVARMANVGQLTAVVATVSALPVAVAFYFLAEPILSIYGEGFSLASEAMKVLVISQFIQTAMGSVTLWLVMSKNENLSLICNALGVAVVFILGSWLIPVYGVTGGAVANAVGAVISGLLTWVFVIRKLRMDPSVIGAMRRVVPALFDRRLPK